MLSIEPISSGSKGNAYYITDGEDSFLVECGVSIYRLKKWCFDHQRNYRTVDACFVSHAHKDHSLIAKSLLELGIKVVLPYSAITELQLRWGTGLRLFTEDKSYIRFGKWVAYALPAEHDAETFAYVFDRDEYRIYYITDSARVLCDVNKVTHLMIECNYSDEILAENAQKGEISAVEAKRIKCTHMSIEGVKKAISRLDKSRLEEVWLIHISERNADREAFRAEIQELVKCPVYIA